MSHCYFKVPKDIRRNTTHCLIMKIFNKRELQIVLNYLSNIEFKDFVKVTKG